MIAVRVKLICAASLVVVVVAAGVAKTPVHASPAQQRSSGWQLPPDAPDKKNPLTVDATVLADGKKLYADKCRKCHGPNGLGDGPDADPDHAEEMNLTNPKRAERNPDGVVFYKVSNGRRNPKMPPFKEELSENQIWTVVSYVQTLRKK